MPDNTSPISRLLVTFAAFTIIVAGLKMADTLIVPFILAVFIAMVVAPLVTWLRARSVPNGLAIFLVVVLMLSIGFLLGAIVGSALGNFRQDLPEYSSKLGALSSGLQQWLSARGIAVSAEQWQNSFDPGALMALVANMLASFGNVMTDGMMILLTVIFILAENTGFAEKLTRARGLNGSSQWLQTFTDSVNSYMAIKTAISFVTGLVIFIWLSILGVDYAVLWGLLTFLFNFVPAVGSVIAAVPAVMLAIIQLGFGSGALVFAGFFVVNMLMGNVIEPRWMGRGLNLSPLVVLVSLVLWGWVLGPVGMLLSIPLTIMLKIGLESQTETRWIGTMLGAADGPSG
ncbi:AI-2E family transporter [Porticoccaceae bacterium]|nr:AI-2E family transporter [Porticoccaceae bacterium]